MSLIVRIARSDRDPQRTIVALRLVNERLMRELAQCMAHSHAGIRPKGSHVLDRLRRAETQQSKISGAAAQNGRGG